MILLPAEVTLDRSAESERGMMAAAALFGVMAAIAVTTVLRRGMRPGPAPAAPPRHLTQALEFFSGLAIIVALSGAAVLITRPVTPAPPGWSIIRPPQEVSALAIEGDIIWAGGLAGLAAIHRLSAASRPIPVPLFRHVRDLLVDRSGNLWAAHRDGISVRRNGAWTHPLTGTPAYALLEDSRGSLWAGTQRGALRDMQATSVTSPTTFLYEDRAGSVWLACDMPDSPGLIRLNAAGSRLFTTADGLGHNAVNAIAEDASGGLWFATGFGSRGGATRLKGGEWRTWTQREGLAGAKARSVFHDRRGRIWFGSEYDGVAMFDGNSWRTLTPRSGLSGWEVKRMVQDGDNTLWLATENGLTRIAELR